MVRDLGPIYGHQWRNFGATLRADGTYDRDGVDQIARVVRDIVERPHSRRLIVTGWNPREADQVALPPCHTMFQLHVQWRRAWYLHNAVAEYDRPRADEIVEDWDRGRPKE